MGWTFNFGQRNENCITQFGGEEFCNATIWKMRGKIIIIIMCHKKCVFIMKFVLNCLVCGL
jgi:hypothetical protein